MSRVGAWFDGMKPFVIGAAVLVFFGVLALLLELQSPSFVLWDGIKVHGDTYRGLTTYKYKGESYSLDRPEISASDTRHIPTTIWLSRDDPEDTERALIENAWERWTDFVFVASGFILALVVIGVGWIRMIRRRRRRDARMVQDTFGTGLDPALIARILAERRSPPPPTAGPRDDA